jgi:hypothetical protein
VGLDRWTSADSGLLKGWNCRSTCRPLAFERLDPVPDVGNGDLGRLGDPRIGHVPGGILRQVEDRLENHPLGTDQPGHKIAFPYN